MECALGRARKAWELYQRMSPVLRGAKEPELYRAEPYVTPGNVDGQGLRRRAAPVGRGTPGRRRGCTAFPPNGSWASGPVGRPAGPAVPAPAWNEAEATRVFRGGTYRITIRRDSRNCPRAPKDPVQRQRTGGMSCPSPRARPTPFWCRVWAGPLAYGRHGRDRPRDGAPRAADVYGEAVSLAREIYRAPEGGDRPPALAGERDPKIVSLVRAGDPRFSRWPSARSWNTSSTATSPT